MNDIERLSYLGKKMKDVQPHMKSMANDESFGPIDKERQIQNILRYED